MVGSGSFLRERILSLCARDFFCDCKYRHSLRIQHAFHFVTNTRTEPQRATFGGTKDVCLQFHAFFDRQGACAVSE